MRESNLTLSVFTSEVGGEGGGGGGRDISNFVVSILRLIFLSVSPRVSVLGECLRVGVGDGQSGGVVLRGVEVLSFHQSACQCCDDVASKSRQWPR